MNNRVMQATIRTLIASALGLGLVFSAHAQTKEVEVGLIAPMSGP